MNVSEKDLDFFIEKRQNVLFRGKHGVGKTSIMKDAFERNGLRYKYFSASTMDPWVDFIGIPKEKQEGDNTYLTLVRPKEFALDQVEALFFDEFNRAPEKVRNAVMELIQFKSINGKKFNNLKMVWAAINPKDEEGKYDVHELDPAQEDRFTVQVDIPYAPDKKYFVNKYGSKVATGAINWWNGLPDEMKDLVSPRRLDECINLYQMGGKMAFVLPQKCNISKLVQAIASEDSKSKVSKLIDNEQTEEVENMLTDDNIYSELETFIFSDKKYSQKLIPLVPSERLAKVLSETTDKNIRKAICSLVYSNDKITDIVRSVREVTKVNELINDINTFVPTLSSEFTGKNPVPPTFVTDNAMTQEEMVRNTATWNEKKMASGTTVDRQKIVDAMQNLPATIPEVEATQLLFVLVVAIIKSQEKTLKADIERYFGPLNHLLQQTKKDVKSSPELKSLVNKLINMNLQEYIWVPETK